MAQIDCYYYPRDDAPEWLEREYYKPEFHEFDHSVVGHMQIAVLFKWYNDLPYIECDLNELKKFFKSVTKEELAHLGLIL